MIAAFDQPCVLQAATHRRHSWLEELFSARIQHRHQRQLRVFFEPALVSAMPWLRFPRLAKTRIASCIAPALWSFRPSHQSTGSNSLPARFREAA